MQEKLRDLENFQRVESENRKISENFSETKATQEVCFVNAPKVIDRRSPLTEKSLKMRKTFTFSSPPPQLRLSI